MNFEIILWPLLSIIVTSFVLTSLYNLQTKNAVLNKNPNWYKENKKKIGEITFRKAYLSYLIGLLASIFVIYNYLEMKDTLFAVFAMASSLIGLIIQILIIDGKAYKKISDLIPEETMSSN